MGRKFDTTVWIAARQHGCVAWRQLVTAGVDRYAIERWLADGRLHRVHRGVYVLGHPGLSAEATDMAAVLACGPGAALSHRSAARRLRLLPRSPAHPEVTVPTTAGRGRRGIVIHRVAALDVLDTARLGRIPITTVPRVLLDLAPHLSRQILGRACHEAWVHHGTTRELVEACIARNRGKKGAARLRAALGADVTLSELESAFLALLREHDLPPPRTNVDLGGDKVDCHWPHCGLTVELLSFRYHGTRHAFEADVARRRRSGHVAFTYGDILEHPTATIAELTEKTRNLRPRALS